MDERTATVDGTPVRWLEQDGDGVPVVLVHGIPTSPALWRHVVPRLEGLRVALEMTGYGDSIPAGEGRDLSLFQELEYGERFARDLGAPLRRIAGGKHFTPEDHPDVLAEEIRGLHAEVSGTGTP